MAISVFFNLQKKRISLSVTDHFLFPDFLGAWSDILQRPDFLPELTMVWDLSPLEASSFLDSDLQRIAEFLQGQARVSGHVIHVALIAPAKATYGLASSYLEYLLEDQTNFSVFRTRKSGEEWLDSKGKEGEANK